MNNYFYIIAGLLILLWIKRKFSKKRRIRKDIMSGEFMHYTDFEDRWIIDEEDGKVGFKYEDGPGCYVIAIYDKPVKRKSKYKNYENIYIGQSVNVCKRVHNHFNGKGNGDVYADIKYGKEVYVRFVKCKKERMNDLEKQLIETFDATSSYNKTKGGATIR